MSDIDTEEQIINEYLGEQAEAALIELFAPVLINSRCYMSLEVVVECMPIDARVALWKDFNGRILAELEELDASRKALQNVYDLLMPTN